VKAVVVLGRSGRPSDGEMRETQVSVPDIGRSLRLARERAGYSLDDMAERTALDTDDLEALEGGTVNRMDDRIETLRSLRTYANALGLPGNEYVLATLEVWPSSALVGARGPDSGQVPAVSVSSAPAGGHSRAETSGTVWVGDRTGVTAGTVTGSMAGQVPGGLDGLPFAIVDTGQLNVIGQGVPRVLQLLVAAAAVLVLLGGFTLFEHQNFANWQHDISTESSHLVDNAKVAVGLSPKASTGTAAAKNGKSASTALPAVTMIPNNKAHALTVNVDAASFTVKMVAFKNASWMQVTDADHASPIYEQVLAGGQNISFPVDHALTVETGSAAARAYIYEGTHFIGYYFPTVAPFTMTFNALG